MPRNWTIPMLLTATLALAACGEVKEQAEKGFKDGFVEEFSKECVNSAKASGAPEAKLKQVCDCTGKKMVETQSITELATNSEKSMEIMKQCAAEAGLPL